MFCFLIFMLSKLQPVFAACSGCGVWKQWVWVQFWQEPAPSAEQRASAEFSNLEMEMGWGIPVSFLVTTELVLISALAVLASMIIWQ